MSKETIRVLLVEDDEDDYVLVRDFLTESRDSRFELDWVQNYEKALEEIGRNRHDVYLVDYRLGDHTGLELLEEVSLAGCRTPIIMLTGQGAHDVDLDAMHAGAADYLDKRQINPLFLERSIRYAIDRKQVERELRDYRDRLEELVSERTAQLEEANTRLRAEILERSRTREALKDSEEKYRTLVESSSDAIMMVDLERRIISFNQAFLDLFGYSAAEVQGQSVRMLHPSDESFVRFRERAYATWKESEPSRTEWNLMRKGGTVFPIEATYSAISGPRGELNAYVAIIRDITERRAAEEELRRYRDHLEDLVRERTRALEAAQKVLIQKEKLKTLGAISAEVAHEIRNPLVSIGGFARRLQKKMPDSPELGIILNESMRLEKLLGRIKNYLKAVENRPTECSVNAIINSCLALLSPELERRRVTCLLKLDESIPYGYVDPEILTQVIINLVRNAADEMESGVVLNMRTYEGTETVCIELESPASGRKDPESLFLPFDKGGHSIGLPLSYRLLREMGGHLIFSQHEGRINFKVCVPKCCGAERDPARTDSRLTDNFQETRVSEGSDPK